MGFVVESLQGEMEQLQRTLALEKFANGSTHIMVATDVAARGLDIKAVDLVINYQLAVDVTTHIHRIGRTGRAGLTGLAVSLWAEQERKQLASIEEKMQRSLKIKGIEAVRFHANRIIKPVWQTLCLHGGKKAKISATDILGVLTQQAKISADDVGKIRVTASHSYVAIKIRSVKRALTHFREGRIKGKKIKAVKG
jgi:ATP-independent RNA helicase DbpA